MLIVPQVAKNLKLSSGYLENSYLLIVFGNYQETSVLKSSYIMLTSASKFTSKELH